MSAQLLGPTSPKTTGHSDPAGRPGPIRRPRRRRRSGWAVLPVVVGLLGASAVVWQRSEAAFTGTTSNPSNTWSVGTVSLTDDDASAAMFNAAGLFPGSTGQRCLTVTYGGSVEAPVRMYVPTTTGTTILSYLDLVVEEGTGGSFADCTGFTPSSTLFTGTLDAAATDHAGYDDGWSTWTPNGAAQSRTYRIAYTLNASTPDTEQGLSATATFQWEARTA